MLHDIAVNIFEMVTAVISSIRIVDVIDIAVVTFAIYSMISFIQKTRARQILNGLIVLIAFMVASDFFGLRTIYFLLSNGMRYGLVALIVIFYPELRQALEYLGRRRLHFVPPENSEKNKRKQMIQQIVRAVDDFSAHKVGALIVLEREVLVGDMVDNRTILDADVTTMLLKTIFYEGTALHDGAVIIRKDRIYAAGCILPLSPDKNLEKTLGTRHRAGLGITEHSDAVSIIVSEETGIISMASAGKLSRFLELKSIEKLLYDLYLTGTEETESWTGFFSSFLGGKRDEQ